MEISVIIPAYNAASYISEAIESVLAQTLKPHEIIIVDDGSTDDTAGVVSQFGNAVTCIRQENKGVSAARNRAIQTATGNWIAFLDADDLWDPRKLELQAAAILRSGAVLAYTGHSIMRDHKILQQCTVPDGRQVHKVLRERCVFMPSSVLVQRSVVLEARGFDETMRSASEDWDLWVRLSRLGHAFVAIPEPLFTYRLAPAGITHQAQAFYDAQIAFVTERLTEDLPRFRRWFRRRRIISRLQAEAAILLRGQGNPRYKAYMVRSLLTWPLPLSLNDRRYKVAIVMLLRRDRKSIPRNDLRAK